MASSFLSLAVVKGWACGPIVNMLVVTFVVDFVVCGCFVVRGARCVQN